MQGIELVHAGSVRVHTEHFLPQFGLRILILGKREQGPGGRGRRGLVPREEERRDL